MTNLQDKFTWERMGLFFPEWANDSVTGVKEDIFWKDLSESPTFIDGRVSFLFNRDYGIEISLRHEIPKWLPLGETTIGTQTIKEHYKELSQGVYEDVSAQLNSSFGVFESWRPFIKSWNGIEWRGHLSSNLSFNNSSTGDCVKLTGDK